MKRIFLERLLVFAISCIFLFVSASKQSQGIEEIETTFLSDVSTLMEQYHYKKEDSMVYDLKYVQENNYVYYDYDMTDKGIKSLRVGAYIHLKINDDLNNTYAFLNDLYEENIGINDNEIKNMIDNFILTGEEQQISNSTTDKQFRLTISKSEYEESDYKLSFNIW